MFICQACGSECDIDGEYPELFVWCDECDDYASGFDIQQAQEDYLTGLMEVNDE